MSRDFVYKELQKEGFNPNIVFDCGCAWGEWSNIIKNIYRNTKIFGFDANIWNEGNVLGCDVFENVVLFNENTNIDFYRKKENIEMGTFCTGDSIYKENTQHYQLNNTIITNEKTTTLNDILLKYNIDSINLIKLDTQGSELKILDGLGEKLKDIEFLEIECSLVNYNNNGCSFYDVIDYLKNDFIIFDILENHYHYEKYLCQIDVLFQNKKSNIKKLM